MYYCYEITELGDIRLKNILSITATLLKICGALSIVVGGLMYRNTIWCVCLVSIGLIVAILGLIIENRASKMSFIWQYIVDADKFVVRKRFNNGDIISCIDTQLADIKIGEWQEMEGYITYDVEIGIKKIMIKSNKYLYALLRKMKNDIFR